MFQKTLKKIFIIVLGGVFFFGLTQQSFALNEQELFGTNSGLVIVAKTDRMIYKVDQDVNITVYLKNKTEEAVDIVEPAIDPQSFMLLRTAKKINC
jgi:hypothetical protein